MLKITMGYIYCITSPSDKKYIGQTTRSCEKRFDEHCKFPKSCILLENAIRKYGKDQMKFEILLMIDNELLDEYEIKLIDLYDTLEPSGYNIRSGGGTGKHSDASKERMREKKLGVNNHNFGKPRSDQTKQAISAAKCGSKHHFFGKELTTDHKLALSKAHKKCHTELPMYLIYVKERPSQYQSSGYAVINHPVLPNKYFTTKHLSDEDKFKKAYEYLEQHGCSSETKW